MLNSENEFVHRYVIPFLIAVCIFGILIGLSGALRGWPVNGKECAVVSVQIEDQIWQGKDIKSVSYFSNGVFVVFNDGWRINTNKSYIVIMKEN